MAKTKFTIEPGAKVTKAVVVFIEDEAGVAVWGDKNKVAHRYGIPTSVVQSWYQKMPKWIQPHVSRFPPANGKGRGGRWLFRLSFLDERLEKNVVGRESRR